MGLYTIKPRFQKLINNLVNLSLRYHLQPDFYTYGACLASLFALISIWVGLKLNPFFLLLVFPFCCVRILFNALDGLVARAYQSSDPLGRVKNELGDRVSDLIIFSGLFPLPEANCYLINAVLILMQFSSYLGILNTKRIYAGFMAKADRMLYLSLFFFLRAFFSNSLFTNAFLFFIVAGLLETVIVRLKLITKEGIQ